MDESGDSTWFDKQNDELLRSQFPLHSAIRDGDLETTLSLLKSGRFDLYEEDGFYGWTPVHWAAHFGKLDCLTELLQHGASCDAATFRFNQTPAHIAALASRLHCLKWLLHWGASLNRQLDILRKLVSLSKDGSPVVWSSHKQVTPAHLASFSGHPHCLQWLLQAGTDPNIQDFLGETPLHKAARSGSMECISLLSAQGCALGLRNHNGDTPSQVAAHGGFHECALQLEKSLQFQEQSMAANIVNTYNCNNNNIQASANPISDMNGEVEALANPFSEMNGKDDHRIGDVRRNGGVQFHNGDVDMGCEMDSVTEHAEESMHKPHINGYHISNGFHLASQNGCFGTKRGRDDYEEEFLKRRRCDERPSCHIEATSDNNNILSSYNAVLAISATPSSSSVPSSNSAEPYPCQLMTRAVVIADSSNNMQLNSSVVEHQSSVVMQRGYDSLLHSSFTSQQ